MKKFLFFCSFLFLMLSFSAGALADVAAYDWDISRDCDYDRYVATTDGGVNFRTEPNIKAEILYTIPDFQRLHITMESTNGWGYTTYNGAYGWVALNQLSADYPAVDTQKTVTVSAADGVNLREGPDVSYAKVRPAIPTGEVLTVTAVYTKKNWGYVTYNGDSGWIALSEVREGAAAPKEEQVTDTDEEEEALDADDAGEIATAQEVTLPEKEKSFPLIPFLIGLCILVVVFAAMLLIILLTKKGNS